MTSIRQIFAVTALTAFALSACDGSDESADSLASTEPSETIAASSTTSATSTTLLVVVADTEAPITTDLTVDDTVSPEPLPDTGDPAIEPDPTPETAAGSESDPGADDDGSCLVGDWVITDEELDSYYSELAANSGGGITINVSGPATISFSEGSFLYVAMLDLDMEVAGQTAAGFANGSVNGNYTTAAGVITTSQEAGGIDASVTVAGITMDGSDLANGILDSFPINAAPYSCDGPTLYFQSGPSPDQRHPIVLAPA